MSQRCWNHDYCAPCFYLITIVTEPRRNCLGALHSSDNGNAFIKLSGMGEAVLAAWRRTSSIYSGIEACECVVMPDHFHGLLRVKENQPRPLGHIIKAFKIASTMDCRELRLLQEEGVELHSHSGSAQAEAPSARLWQTGFTDTILQRRGQLKSMVAYIADNPRRLALKKANPDYFTTLSGLEVIPGVKCAAVGNRFLLDYPMKKQVQVSRHVSSDELNFMRQNTIIESEHGVVPVSPCISPGEKTIAKAVLETGKPLILLLANGFPPMYKPSGRYFDDCASGRLLMIAPFPYCRQRVQVTREQCLELNKLAKAITLR